jgi:branched-chain amino acid transport system substrate-binding protein
MKKTIIWVVVVLVVVGLGWLISGNKSTAPSGGAIKIGAIYPLTGGLAIYGEPAQKATALAVEDINKAGGINGKNLEVVFEDHKCDPKTALSAFQKLSAEGVKVFTSVACSGTALAIAPELANNQAVLLGTTLSTPKLSGVSPFLFRNWASDIQESKLFADEVQKQGYKKVAAIYEATDYAKGLVINMQDFLKDSGVSFDTESFVTGATDVRTQLTKIQATKPDVIFVSVQTVTSGEVVLKQLEELDIKTKLFLNDNIIIAPQLVSAHSKFLEGSLGAQYVLQSPEVANQALVEYKTKYGVECSQPAVCAAAYDTTNILAKALKETDGSANAVKQYLSQVNYAGASGQISFDQNNDRVGAIYSMFVVKGGVVEKI